MEFNTELILLSDNISTSIILPIISVRHSNVSCHFYNYIGLSIDSYFSLNNYVMFSYVENIDFNTVETIPVRCVTASLKVDFKAPTPMGKELELKGKLRSIEGRKIWVDMTLSAEGITCVTGEILAIRLEQ